MKLNKMSSFNMKRKSAQAGYTIVELSIAVAIAGVLLVSAIGLVQTVLTTNRANETTTLLIKAMAQIDKIWADQADYNGLNIAAAGAAGVFNGMQVTRNPASNNVVTAVTSKFNRNIFVGVAPNLPTAGAGRGYVLTFAGIPTTVCADLVTAAAGAGIRGIMITPEAAVTAAPIIPPALAADGALTPTPAGTAIAMDASMSNLSIPSTMGNTGCGTDRATVALTFVNWK
ncbi:type 4 pilus major pilin [Leptothrix sp. BB-4]